MKCCHTRQKAKAKNAALSLTAIDENENKIKSAAQFLMKMKGFSSQNELNEFLELNELSYIDANTLRINNPLFNELDRSLLDLEEDYGDYEYYDYYADYEEDYGDYVVYEEYDYNYEEDLLVDV
jgi:hypothetical protein